MTRNGSVAIVPPEGHRWLERFELDEQGRIGKLAVEMNLGSDR